jgi:hypothetical protein
MLNQNSNPAEIFLPERPIYRRVLRNPVTLK